MKLKHNKKPFIIALCAASVLSAAATVWRTLVIRNHYDPYAQIFDSAANGANTALTLIIFAFAAAMIAFAVVTRKTPLKNARESSGVLHVGSSALMGILFITSSAVAAITITHSGELFSAAGRQNAIYKICVVTAIALGIMCGFYFLAGAAQKKSSRKMRKYLSVILPVWSIAFMFASYFDANFLYSDVNRHFANIAAASVVLLMITETRTHAAYSTSPTRFAAALAALLACSTYCIPTLILTAFWALPISGIVILETVEIAVIPYAVSAAVDFIKDIDEKKEAAAQAGESRS